MIPDQTLQNLDISYYPPKSLAITIPTFTIIGVILIPVVYALLNHLSSPSYTSKETLWDSNSIQMTVPKSSDNAETSSVPEFCDLDVALINASVSKTLR